MTMNKQLKQMKMGFLEATSLVFVTVRSQDAHRKAAPELYVAYTSVWSCKLDLEQLPTAASTFSIGRGTCQME